MNWRAVRAIVRRDLGVVLRSRAVLLPLIIMPALFTVGMPLALGLLVSAGGSESAGGDAGSDVFDAMPAAWLDGLPDQPGAQVAALMLTRFLPVLTLLVPPVVAQVVATDAIAGERERGTLEGLLLTPVSDRELLLSKCLVAFLPAVAILVAGGLCYLVVTDVVMWPHLGGPLLPTPGWLHLQLWLGPAISAAALSVSVLVSARTRTVQGAQQIAGIAVLPILFMAVGQFAGILVDTPLIWALGAALWLIAAGCVALGARSVRRERLGPRLG